MFGDTQAECAESIEKNERVNIRVSYDWIIVSLIPSSLVYRGVWLG